MKDSKFDLWRATFSLVHLDNIVTEEESTWYKERLRKLPLSLDQKNILEDDFTNKKPITDFVDLITNKVDKAFLLHQVRVISYLDNDYSSNEKAFFKKLEADILGNLDLAKITAEIQEVEDEQNKNMSFKEKMELRFQKMINKDK